jgi:hypothetical protein
MAMRLALVGECQICEQIQKLRKKELVLHGYKRPGHGYIVGDCPGVGHPPYELSCERCEVFRDRAIEELESLTARITEVENKTGSIRAYKLDKPWHRWEVQMPLRGKFETKTFKAGDDEYERLRKVTEANLRNRLRYLLSDIDRLTARIDNWKRRPLRTVEEHEAASKPKRSVGKLSNKATTLMRSASKGIKATFSLANLDIVLEALGWQSEPSWEPQRVTESRVGAKIAETLGLPESEWSSGWSDKPTAFDVTSKDESEAGARSIYRAVQALPGFLKRPKAPKSIGEGGTIIHAREPEKRPPWHREGWFVPLTMWHAVPARKVTAPDGASTSFPVRMNYRGHIDLDHVKSDRFWKFAFAHGIQKQAADWLSSQGDIRS